MSRRPCCNPEHLDPVDNRTNVIRGVHGLGREVIRNGWLPEGQQIDIGTLEDEDFAKRRVVKTRCGEAPDWAFTSPEQVELLEKETFQQVRFDDPGKQNLGDGEKVKIGSLTVNGLTESPVGDFTYSVKKFLFALREGAPYWVGEEFGDGRFTTQPGSTFVHGDMEYFVQFCLTKRKSIGQFQGLDA